MSEIDAAPAAAPDTAAPAPEPAAEAPQDTSLRGTLEHHFADWTDDGPPEPAAQETPPTQEAPKAERARDETGKFVKAEGEVTEPQPKEEQPKAEEKAEDKPLANFTEPPSRFSADAKAAWKDAPEPIRAEIHRAVKELEDGIGKYRSDATAYEPLKPYADLAAKHGTDIKTTLDKYLGFSQALTGNNPMPAIQELLSLAGMTPQSFAEKITGQKPEEAQSAMAEENRRLQKRIDQLEQGFNGFKSSFQEQKQALQEQRQAEALKTVESFAKDHPRFEELSDSIAKLLSTGMASDLPEAYGMADRLNPAPQAPQPAPAASNAAPQTPPAQPDKGSLSISGAPSSGSNPVNRKPPSSAREALERAAAQTGAF